MEDCKKEISKLLNKIEDLEKLQKILIFIKRIFVK